MPSRKLVAALATLFAPCAIAAAYTSHKPLPVASVFAPGEISTGDDESHPTFSADGDTLYFLKNTPTFNHWTIVTSRWADGRWGTPVVEPYSGQYNDADVFFAKDGSMFFISNRPVDGKPRTDNEIWMRRKTATGWAEPEHIAALSSPKNEWFPTVADDGTLYFGSGREEDNVHPGTNDLYRSRFVDGHYTKPENLGATINSAGSDTEAWIAPDQSYIVFSSNGYPDTRGADDIYIAWRDGNGWTKPRNLGDAVNSAGSEYGAKPSPDGKYLFFCSNRGFGDRPLDHRLDYDELTSKLHAPGNGLTDIYQVDIAVLRLDR
ncbi:MAG: hypothetical protein ABW186_16720 [Rhodanobacteraceae bacterium]